MHRRALAYPGGVPSPRPLEVPMTELIATHSLLAGGEEGRAA